MNSPISATLGLLLAIAAVAGAVSQAHANLVISTGTTSNVTCSAGVCTATAANAVLNEQTLANMLAGGNVTVTSAAVKASIQVGTPVSWASAASLTLTSGSSILVGASVADNGSGSLTLTTANGGTLWFTSAGKIGFLGLSNKLTINGRAYTLENTLSGLSSATFNKPAGYFALAASITAPSTTYTYAPIGGINGAIEGLGNSITGLKLTDTMDADQVGLIGQVTGTVADLRVVNATIKAGADASAGIVAGTCVGKILRSSASGTVTAGTNAYVGGVVGQNYGTLGGVFSSATVKAGDSASGMSAHVGGVVGDQEGAVTNAAATGAVSGGANTYVGGLVGFNGTTSGTATITDAFAWGSVSGGNGSYIGGFAGQSMTGNGGTSTMTDVYEAGPVSAASGTTPLGIGSFAGNNSSTSLTGAFYFTGNNPSLPAVGSGSSSGINGVSGIALSNLGFSSTLWKNETVCSRQQAVTFYNATLQGIIADNYCS